MQPKTRHLDEVVVQDVQERFRIRGDTAVFNADAYRVNPDASAEDLIGKMPGGGGGQDGTFEAQGEQVQRVTVDGREFFGDDPAVALRNLPADVIQSIEVFDRESDQAQFTGFSDGNRGGGPGGPRFRGPGGPGGRGGERGPGGGSGFNPRDFLVGQQGGLNTTTSPSALSEPLPGTCVTRIPDS